MTPNFAKRLGAVAYPVRGKLLVASLLMIGLAYVAALVDIRFIEHWLKYLGPVLAWCWAFLCAATWFPPPTPHGSQSNFFLRFSVSKMPVLLQWNASTMLGVVFIVFPVMFWWMAGQVAWGGTP